MERNSKPGNNVVAVTGASGFLGQAVARRLVESGHEVICVGRGASGKITQGPVSYRQVNYDDDASIARAIEGVSAIVHCAGLAHVHLPDQAGELYRRVNRDYTMRLWQAACRQGGHEFIFASSIKAFGDDHGEAALHEDSDCSPGTPYGISKLEAERGLLGSRTAGAPRLHILRLPPMYGPGMKGAIRHLFRAARLHLPLPLWGLISRRSVLSVENAARLVEFMIRGGASCATIYAPHEPETMTPGELYNRIYRATHGKDLPRWLRWPAPGWLRMLMARSGKLQALTHSLRLQSKYMSVYENAGFRSLDECMRAVAGDLD